MRFQVPQYIEVEDKIFGPLTFKQFIYIAGSGGLIVLLFSVLPKFFAFLASAPVAALGFALAFYKVNERPFALVIEDFFKYSVGSRLYIWRKEEKPVKDAQTIAKNAAIEQLHVPTLSGSKLKDLTFELDVKNQSNPVTKDTV
jgi:hypothetical protein